MNGFSRRLAERWADVLDWIDYRRDANFWPFFVIPPMLSVTWAYGGWIGVGMVAAFGIGVALLIGIFTALAIAGWVLANAMLDVAVPAFASLGQRTYTSNSRTATSP